MNFFKLKYLLTIAALCAFSEIVKATETDLIQSNATFALSSSQLTNQPFIFEAGFNPIGWTGSLKKKSIIQQSDGTLELSPDETWEAGALLTAQAPDKRLIATYNHTNKQTIPFEWDQLPKDIQRLFNKNPNTTIIDELGPKRVSYLRGDRTMENKGSNTTPFRARESLLGNIMHSTPIYVGAPSKNVIGANYARFYEQYKNRPATVFVGANDGMLHAFSAEAGSELFAYIPSPLLKKLPKLTDPAYQHIPTMDGNLHVAEANVAGQWKTILTGGMGQGARGVFTLDITTPEQFMAGQSRLFEFTEEDDSDIGYITSSPAIIKIHLKKNNKSLPLEKYFVLVTSGYQSNNSHGEQFLFLLSLDKSPATPWLQNKNYYKIRMKTGLLVTNLSAPGLVFNPRGVAMYGYSGDLQGNLWRFDFSNGNPATMTPKIIFSAKDNHHHPQEITAQPMVAFGPDQGYLVLFGTGNPLENIHQQNSFYAIHDVVKKDELIKGRSELAARELIATNDGYQIRGENFSYGKSSPDKRGWYMDYLSQAEHCKERSLSESTLAYGTVFFNTLQTCISNSQEINISRSYKLDVATGKTAAINQLTGFSSSTYMPGKPILLSTSSVKGSKDVFGRRYNTQQYSILNFSKGMELSTATLKAGRLSWREIANWQDLKNK